jgi:pimeloyl-ACP methyl ester carboxylesterase
VLVGHSRGGAVISRAAELVPDAIRRLVYLSAYLLTDGESVAAEARRDTDSLVAPNMIPVKRGITCTLRPEVLREAFYGCCNDSDAQNAIARLSPEPLKGARRAAADLRRALWPRAACLHRNHARPRRDARGAATHAGCAALLARVHAGDDHSAFLSQPEALARILISI